MKERIFKAPSELQSHIGFWLRFVSNHVSHAFAQRLLDSGVTVAEWVVLRQVFDREGIAPSDLAEVIGLTRGAISKLAERLIAKQLLARRYAKDDRRYQTLALTPAGRALVPGLAKLADENDEEFFAALSPKQRKRLVATLMKLVEANHLKALPVE